MKGFSKLFLVLLLGGLLIFTACSNKTDTGGKKNEGDEGKKETKIEYVFGPETEGEIDFWTWSPDFYEDMIAEFNKTYPNIKVKLSVMATGELHDKLSTTLAAGSGACDVCMIEVGNFPRFVVGDLLEDLFQPPYDIGRYEDLVPDFIWHQWRSLDGKKMYGIPNGIAPGVWFYREDIYEQMGFPNDPEELGEFLQDEDNFMQMAQTFAANDMYIMEFNDSPFIHMSDMIGYYDNDLNYLRNTNELADMLDLVKKGAQLNWAPHMSGLYSDEGKQLLKQGKLVSLPQGAWAARALSNAVPEQEGKWRATRMPLGNTNTIGGSTYVIPAQSNNKEAAWAWLEWLNLSEDAWKIFTQNNLQPAWRHIVETPWYQESTNPFLGDQKANALYAEISELTPRRIWTPLDGKTWPIFIDEINKSIANNIDSKTTLQTIENNVMKQLGADIEKLKEDAGLN
nr:extracellular solute-binding protein [Paenibacillus bovis]